MKSYITYIIFPIQKSSNPTFLRSFLIFEKFGISDETELRISAFDLRDRFTATRTLLGSANILIQDLKEQGRSLLGSKL